MDNLSLIKSSDIYVQSLMLIKTVIFCYHGLEDEEKEILEELANGLEAKHHLDWALAFVHEDIASSYDRCRTYLSENLAQDSNEVKLALLYEAWKATYIKGYITEIEATAMLRLSKIWSLERDFLSLIRK